jgi:hypothetical protein
VSCDATDTDKCLQTNGTWLVVNDSLTIWWTGTNTFKDNINLGPNPTSICTDSEGDNSVTVNVDDNKAQGAPPGAPANDALFEEDGEDTTRYFPVIIPVVDEIEYGGTKHAITDVTTPEYTRSPLRNEPVSSTRSTLSSETSITAAVKYWHVEELADGSNIEIRADTTGSDISRFQPVNATFGGTWPTAAITNTAVIHQTTIKKISYTAMWQYRVPTGSNNWITMLEQPHTVYAMWGSRLCAVQLYTKANIDLCVGWATGCDKVDTSNDANNVARQIQLAAKGWHQQYGYVETGVKDDPFTYIPAHKGDCITYADLMTKAVKLLGHMAITRQIHCHSKNPDGSYNPNGTEHWFYSTGRTPYWVEPTGDADGDGTENQNEAGYPNTIDTVYVPGKDPHHNAQWRADNAPWNFHGASQVAGHWWEITMNTTPDHDTEENMHAWPNGPVITYPGPLNSNDF